jgi:hypothetical protein
VGVVRDSSDGFDSGNCATVLIVATGAGR